MATVPMICDKILDFNGIKRRILGYIELGIKIREMMRCYGIRILRWKSPRYDMARNIYDYYTGENRA